MHFFSLPLISLVFFMLVYLFCVSKCTFIECLKPTSSSSLFLFTAKDINRKWYQVTHLVVRGQDGYQQVGHAALDNTSFYRMSFIFFIYVLIWHYLSTFDYYYKLV